MHGPALNLFSLVWQLAMTNGQYPVGLQVTTGKKLYPVSSIQKIGEGQYRVGNSDVSANRFQFKRGDHAIEYALAPGFNNIPVYFSYKVNDKVYAFRLTEAAINGRPVLLMKRHHSPSPPSDWLAGGRTCSRLAALSS